MLEKFKLKDAIHQYPHQMSGGMRQRVAIAQALIIKPSIILLDEPFGALDESTRSELQQMLLDLKIENTAARENLKPQPHTLIIVTHELNEALRIGDRVIGLTRNWDWPAGGYDDCPGATITHDVPVLPETQSDIREKIRQAVFVGISNNQGNGTEN